jgi:hypothetical protein
MESSERRPSWQPAGGKIAGKWEKTPTPGGGAPGVAIRLVEARLPLRLVQLPDQDSNLEQTG